VTEADGVFLRRALALAALGARTTAPNPPVGCVIVRDGAVLGEGWHVAPGMPHAERVALAAATEDPAGATAYVSLEPCSHGGRPVPPCADALIEAGIARVVVGATDPAPWVDGDGIARLTAAGVVVDVADPGSPAGIAARVLTAGFRRRVRDGRPCVTYKAAATLDGRTATAAGDSRWISSPESRALVHEWRAASQAVLVGIGTVLADDPMLTARDCDPPAERQPLRVVADRSARLPPASALARTAAEHPVLVLASPAAPRDRRAALEAAGVEVEVVESLADGLALLATRDVNDVLCEGGARLAGALLADGLIDRTRTFIAPLVLGDAEGTTLFGPALHVDEIAAAAPLAHLTARPVGVDILLEGWLSLPT
jgi:diaminohydroxyphosphoribosylaminopyrimidine deaminase / 5-amino-6-(5-phosphoribosylamino)uracil reductase